MYTNFAKSVYTYFQNRMKETGLPLDTLESQIFRQAERCSHSFPISCMTRDDLETLGYKVDDVDDEKLQRLAVKVGDDFHEQLYWDSLDSLAFRYGFDKRNPCEEMRQEYEQLMVENKTVKSASVIIQYKNNDQLSQVIIALSDNGEEKDGYFLKVENLDELCALFNKDNRYGFYIKEFISFQ